MRSEGVPYAFCNFIAIMSQRKIILSNLLHVGHRFPAIDQEIVQNARGDNSVGEKFSTVPPLAHCEKLPLSLQHTESSPDCTHGIVVHRIENLLSRSKKGRGGVSGVIGGEQPFIERARAVADNVLRNPSAVQELRCVPLEELASGLHAGIETSAGKNQGGRDGAAPPDR